MGAVDTAADPLTGHTATFDYTDDGLPATITWRSGSGNGASRLYSYDGLGRLVEWTRPDSEVIANGNDAAPNRTTVDDPDGTRTASYDVRNRLLTVTGAGQPNVSQTWTPRSTLATSTTGTDQTSFTFAFERPTQVTAPGFTTSYGYDGLDRLATSGTAPHLYADLTNTPVRVPTGSGDALITRAPGGAPLAAQTASDSLPGAQVGGSCSSSRLRLARSFWLARRIAAARTGAPILAKPVGSPRLRSAMRVRAGASASQV
jgi:uncharacterized protein RhaS with RHS repeats